MCLPSGESATEWTIFVCPVKGPAVVSPVTEFHTRIVRSEEPETMCWPSGENATDMTQPVCDVKGPVAFSLVITFHTRIFRSCEPETMGVPASYSESHLHSHYSLDSGAENSGDCGDVCQHGGVERRWDDWHRGRPEREMVRLPDQRSADRPPTFSCLLSVCIYQLDMAEAPLISDVSWSAILTLQRPRGVYLPPLQHPRVQKTTRGFNRASPGSAMSCA